MRVVNRQSESSYGAVYVGRPTLFGNPFKIGTDGDRGQVIQKYREYFHQRIKTDELFKSKVMKLKGRDLSCWCAPLPCHADVIVEYLERTG